MKRIDAKLPIQRALSALNYKMSKLPTGLLDHLTDIALLSEDPEALVEEFRLVADEPVGRPARRLRKLVRTVCEAGVPPTACVTESVGRPSEAERGPSAEESGENL